MRTKVALIIAAMAVVVAAPSIVAHHAFSAQFDGSKTFKYTGPVTKVEWMNPHTYFYVDVKNDETGEVTNWAMEMGSPNVLMRNGWSRNTLKIGDVVVVEGSMAKDGSATGNARTVVLAATGQRLFAGSSQGVTP